MSRAATDSESGWGASAAVVMRLVCEDKTLNAAPAMYYGGPNYSTFYGGYWGYGWGGMYDPGYVKMDRILHVETLVYSLPLDTLLWAGVSTTTNPKEAQAFVSQLIERAVKEMKKQRLVK